MIYFINRKPIIDNKNLKRLIKTIRHHYIIKVCINSSGFTSVGIYNFLDDNEQYDTFNIHVTVE